MKTMLINSVLLSVLFVNSVTATGNPERNVNATKKDYSTKTMLPIQQMEELTDASVLNIEYQIQEANKVVEYTEEVYIYLQPDRTIEEVIQENNNIIEAEENNYWQETKSSTNFEYSVLVKKLM